MSVADKLKGIGATLAGVAILAAVIALTVVVLRGVTWVSVTVSPLLMPTFFWTLIACLFVLGPSALFHRTRGFAAVGLMFASYVFGFILWVWSFLLTLKLLGMFAVIVGLIFFGIGIVPVALLAVLFNADWSSLGDMAILLVATFGSRILALWLAAKVDRQGQVYLE
jgi:hypothetical protein